MDIPILDIRSNDDPNRLVIEYEYEYVLVLVLVLVEVEVESVSSPPPLPGWPPSSTIILIPFSSLRKIVS